MQQKIKTKIMEKINKNEVKMKPKWWFVVGSVLSLLGVTLSGVVAAYMFNLGVFLGKANGFGRGMRFEQTIKVLPWWILLVAVLMLVSGVLLLKQYDFSYKKNFGLVVLGLVVSVMLMGTVLNGLGVNENMARQKGVGGKFYGSLSNSLVNSVPNKAADMNLESALKVAIDDEYKAWTTYKAILEKFGEVRPFSNIIRAEEQHISMLETLFKKYGLDVPENNWIGKVVAPESVSIACNIGAEAEIDNYKLYEDKLIPQVSDYVDVVSVFNNLASASKNKHLVAFERCK